MRAHYQRRHSCSRGAALRGYLRTSLRTFSRTTRRLATPVDEQDDTSRARIIALRNDTGPIGVKSIRDELSKLLTRLPGYLLSCDRQHRLVLFRANGSRAIWFQWSVSPRGSCAGAVGSIRCYTDVGESCRRNRLLSLTTGTED